MIRMIKRADGKLAKGLVTLLLIYLLWGRGISFLNSAIDLGKSVLNFVGLLNDHMRALPPPMHIQRAKPQPPGIRQGYGRPGRRPFKPLATIYEGIEERSSSSEERKLCNGPVESICNENE